MNLVGDKLSESEDTILNMEKKNEIEKKKMENYLYSHIKNSDTIIREVLKEKKEKEEIINKYKDIIDKSDIKIKELETKCYSFIEKNNIKYSGYELEINNYKMKLTQLKNDNLIKDSIIKKMKGEIQILKAELSKNNSKNDIYNPIENYNNNAILSTKKNKVENNQFLVNYSSKIKDLQNEINSLKLKNNKDESLLNHNLLKINELELKLKEKQILIDEYENKNNIINEELDETKNSLLNLQMENANIILEKNKELLSTDKIKNEVNIKNKELEDKLNALRIKMNEIEKENIVMKNKISNFTNGLRKNINDIENDNSN